MTNVFGRDGKVTLRNHLFQIGIEALEKDGGVVEKIPGVGKSSVRRVTKGGQSRVVSIRTTQDTYIAFPRNKEDTAWVTLSDVDAVVAVSVDDKDEPRFASVHLIDGDEARDRFDRAYAARLAAGHNIPIGRGVWLPLYIQDDGQTPGYIGGGAGLDNPALERVPLEDVYRGASNSGSADDQGVGAVGDSPLTISEAKRQLAISLGVDPSNIKITVEA